MHGACVAPLVAHVRQPGAGVPQIYVGWDIPEELLPCPCTSPRAGVLRRARAACAGCSAITLGRVAWVCPGQLAPHLGVFAGAWCGALRSISDDVEKEHAFLGLCALLRINPEVRRAFLRGSGFGV